MSSNNNTTQEFGKDGQYRRQASLFLNHVSAEPASPFPAEPNRYALYIHIGCPWAHRTNIVRSLKGLEDIIQLIVFDDLESPNGKILWRFAGEKRDPLYGLQYLKELYEKSEPGYEGKYTVPTLWDKKTEKIVSNESSEIIRMFYTEFDAFIPEHLRESSKGRKGLYPIHLRGEIEGMNDWVYHTINNGVYKTGLATSQAAYEENLFAVFASLDRLEAHLSKAEHQPYLFGDHITEADIRLYPSIVRFDVSYYAIFRCNLKMIRHDYPLIDKWLRQLYWSLGEETNGGAFKKTTDFSAYRIGAATTVSRGVAPAVVPVGPVPDILARSVVS